MTDTSELGICWFVDHFQTAQSYIHRYLLYPTFLFIIFKTFLTSVQGSLHGQANLNHHFFQWGLTFYNMFCGDSQSLWSPDVAFTVWLSFLAACHWASAGIIDCKLRQVLKVVFVPASWPSPLNSHCGNQFISHSILLRWALQLVTAWHSTFFPEI